MDRVSNRVHPLSTYAKYSEKLTFLTPWHANALVRIRELEMLVFRKILRTHLMDGPYASAQSGRLFKAHLITSSRFTLNSTLKIALWSYICMIMWRLLCNSSLAYCNGCNAWLVDLKCYQVFWIMFCINSLVLLLPWMNLRVNEFKFSSCFNFKVERHRVFVILPGWFIRF